MALAVVDGHFWHSHPWIQHDFIFKRTGEELKLVAFVPSAALTRASAVVSA